MSKDEMLLHQRHPESQSSPFERLANSCTGKWAFQRLGLKSSGPAWEETLIQLNQPEMREDGIELGIEMIELALAAHDRDCDPGEVRQSLQDTLETKLGELGNQLLQA